MIKNIVLKKPAYLSGSTAGVVGATALVTLKFDGAPAALSLNRLQSYRVFASLNPGDPHFAVDPTRWASSFVQNVPEQPEFAHLIAAYIVGLLRWARDPVDRAVVISSSEQSIQLAVPWLRKPVLKSALKLTLECIKFTHLETPSKEQRQKFMEEFNRFLISSHRNHLAPNTVRFGLAALGRGIPFTQLDHETIVLGWGKNQLRLKSSFTGNSSTVASSLARHKYRASQLLALNKLPVPEGELVKSLEEAKQLVQRLGWPVVVKPGRLDQGLGVTPGINDEDTLDKAFQQAQKLDSGPVIVERHIEGADHRMLVVKGMLLMTSKRIPAGVTGNGTSTVSELIRRTNQNPLRGSSKRSLLMELKLDGAAMACLSEQALAPDSVPAAGQYVALSKTANMSNGGTAVDVTDAVHPDNRAVAIRAARIIGLDIAGVDFLCPDISKSHREVGGAICEVNAQPGFRPHWVSAPERDINGDVLDTLTGGGQLRIPTAAITGTNGKSTTAKMLHNIWQASGATAGVCTTAGTWIGEDQIDSDNLSGLPGARLLFQDPAVESAIIEVPRKGLLVFGQPCDHYDVAALLNIADDHIGVDGIESLEDMARLKAQVIAKARNAVVLNADDPLCMAMREYVVAPRVILAARDRTNTELVAHLEAGGAGAYIRGTGASASLVLAEGGKEIELIGVGDIPATEGGLIEHNLLNALWASCLAWAQELDTETIKRGLSGFTNDVTINPGRYNYIDGFPFKLMVDFAHNADSASNVLDYVNKLEITGRKILLSQKLGNRHRDDFTRIAPQLAQVFDEIIVTTNPHYVHLNPEYAGDDPEATMLEFTRSTLLQQGQTESQVRTTRDLQEAINWALDTAEPGDFVLMLSEVYEVLPIVQAHPKLAPAV